MEPTLVYEDADIIGVNKPSGLVVHSDGKTKEPSLADWVLARYPETATVGEPGRTANGQEVIRPGIVHRLDRETSGVMLVAKTAAGFAALKEQFQNQQIKKTYHAVVYGRMKDDRGTIDRPIGRSSQDFRRWSAQRGARGELRPAVTDYEVVLRSPDYTFIHAFPQTGRTHQIRVHFKAINHPLVADTLYAPDRPNDLGFTRLALHAQTIQFTDLSGTARSISAPYPADFAAGLETLKASIAKVETV